MPDIETARLLLRPYTPQDLDELAPILSNPAVMRYSPRGPIPKDQAKEVTQEILQFFITHWQQHGFGVWAVVEKATVKLIGHLVFREIPQVQRSNLGRDSGFISSAPSNALRRVRNAGYAHPENIASVRVIQKVGMKFQES